MTFKSAFPESGTVRLFPLCFSHESFLETFMDCIAVFVTSQLIFTISFPNRVVRGMLNTVVCRAMFGFISAILFFLQVGWVNAYHLRLKNMTECTGSPVGLSSTPFSITGGDPFAGADPFGAGTCTEGGMYVRPK